jgi:hypothetical protein
MSDMISGQPLQRVMPPSLRTWVELALATPVVLWAGSPLFVRGWQSIVNRSLNMFTLIGMGIGVAYSYSLVAAVFPNLFPDSFRGADGTVPVYFEAGARRTIGPTPPVPSSGPAHNPRSLRGPQHSRPLRKADQGEKACVAASAPAISATISPGNSRPRKAEDSSVTTTNTGTRAQAPALLRKP